MFPGGKKERERNILETVRLNSTHKNWAIKTQNPWPWNITQLAGVLALIPIGHKLSVEVHTCNLIHGKWRLEDQKTTFESSSEPVTRLNRYKVLPV